MRRRLAALMVTLATAGGGFAVLGAAPAQAYSYGWIYLVFPTWAGNCPNGGSVTYISAAVGPHDDTWSGGDGGDDIIYPRVAMNQWNTVDAEVFCSRGALSNYYPIHSSFYPSRNNETVWVGPDRWWHN